MFQGEKVKDHFEVVPSEGATVTKKVKFQYVPGMEKCYLELRGTVSHKAKYADLPTRKVADGANTTYMLVCQKGKLDLKADGYHNVYYNGSSGVFSGLNKFFLSHGYQEFMGKEDWLEKGAVKPEELNMWAVYDKDIVEFSIRRLDELMAEGRKFSFALSTMDTHEPGFLSSDCEQAGFSRDWPGYVKCSMSQVGRLLQHIRDRGWEKDFVILVMGDHQARMPKLGEVDLKSAEKRFVLCSLKGGELKPMRGRITHFDLFPSILSALGFTVEGGRLGFGYDVFSREVMPPEGNTERLRKRVLSHSKIYESLWLPEYAGKKGE